MSEGLQPLAPRSKLLAQGAASLSVAELLAVLFQAGSHPGSALDLASHLLERFGSLRKLLHAERHLLAAKSGIGDARLAMLRALPELARHYFEETLPRGAAIHSPADTETFLLARLRDRPHEVFCCLYLDLCVALINVELGHRGSTAAGIRRHQLHISTVTTFAST